MSFGKLGSLGKGFGKLGSAVKAGIAALPSLSSWSLEGSTGLWQLEDGSGNWILE